MKERDVTELSRYIEDFDGLLKYEGPHFLESWQGITYHWQDHVIAEAMLAKDMIKNVVRNKSGMILRFELCDKEWPSLRHVEIACVGFKGVEKLLKKQKRYFEGDLSVNRILWMSSQKAHWVPGKTTPQRPSQSA